jgi:ferritin-like metal-binding protein YciE
MPAINNLDDLFVRTLRRVYSAEQRLAKALPRIARAANSRELASAFESHLKETETHVERIERLFVMFNRPPQADTDETLGSLVAGADTRTPDAAVEEAALIVAAQEAERYEIAAYGTLRVWAESLNKPSAVELLERTLDEEMQADQTLTAIAGDLPFRTSAA